MVIIMILGCFLEGASIMLIMIPVILPTLLSYKLDLIWYAVLMVINIEVGLLTPPVGLNLYAVDGVAKGVGISQQSFHCHPRQLAVYGFVFNVIGCYRLIPASGNLDSRPYDALS